MRNVEDSYRELARKALEFAKKTMLEDKPYTLIVDEICLAVHLGLLSVGDVLSFLENIPAKTSIVMTGWYAPKELIDRANFVNEIVDLKSSDRFDTTKGILY